MVTEGRSRAAIACRISRSKDRLGVQRQERELRRLAVALDVDVIGVYVDNSRSAYRANGQGKPRPDYDRLLSDIEAGLLDVVLAWHPDRLHRDVEEHELWIKLVRRHRVRVVTLQAGERDLTKASDRLVARQIAAVSQYESELKSERQRSKSQELAEAGKPQGGHRPFGYESSARIKVVKTEAKAIREAAEKILAGASQGDVVRLFRETGVTTTQGTPWTCSRVRRMLWRSDIAGLREAKILDDQGNVVEDENGKPQLRPVKATWKPIITVDQHERLRTILSNVRRHRAPSVYLLSNGLAICGNCGGPLRGAGGTKNGRYSRRYRCIQANSTSHKPTGTCGKISHRADSLEEYVVDFALHWATSPDVISSRRADRERIAGEAEAVRLRLSDVELREQRLADLAVDGAMPAAQYRRKQQELRREREQLERRLATVQSAEDQITDAGGYDEAKRRWNTLTFGEQRAVLGSLLIEIKVNPAVYGRTVFDPGRISIRPDWSGPLERAKHGDPELVDEIQWIDPVIPS